MWIYIVILIAIAILYIILYKIKYTKYSKLIFCISIFVIFTLIQGLRGGSVGIDTSKYLKYYQMYKEISYNQVIIKDVLNFEIGFGILSKTLSVIHCLPQIYLIIIATIINGRNNVFYI